MARSHLLLLLCVLAAVRAPAAASAQHVLPVQAADQSGFTCWPMARFEVTPVEAAPGEGAAIETMNAPELACCCACDSEDQAGLWSASRAYLRDEFDKLRHDFRNNYTGRHLMGLGIAIAIAAPLANTDADQHFRDYYQRHARSDDLDNLADVGNWFGEHWNVVPIVVAAALGGQWASRYWEGAAVVGIWGDRCARGMLVGAPAVGVLQFGLGASRPEEGSSRWRPFNDNNSVAGHGFIGAVPFLAAASVVENRPAKAAFFAASVLTTWARVHDDSHYLSQAVLGWSIAFLAVQSVQQTDFERQRSISLVPLNLPDGAGVGLLVRY